MFGVCFLVSLLCFVYYDVVCVSCGNEGRLIVEWGYVIVVVKLYLWEGIFGDVEDKNGVIVV